jgi:nucleotide-binding universal stress UspA family protein
MPVLPDNREAGRVEDATGFRSFIVALDLAPNGDRALDVVRSLAAIGRAPVDLLTVSSPNLSEDVDAFELARRAERFGGRGATWTILHHHDPVLAIVEHLARHDDSLLVMATSARAPLTGHFLGSVSEEVLSLVEQPVLLVGPRVEAAPIATPTLVVCVDRPDVAAAAVPAIVAWTRTFGSPTRVVEVRTGDAMRAAGDRDGLVGATDLAELLATSGVTASSSVVPCDGDPCAALLGCAATVSDPIYVATSTRWTDGRLHWHSTARRLVQRSTRPVLVVPAREFSS